MVWIDDRRATAVATLDRVGESVVHARVDVQLRCPLGGEVPLDLGEEWPHQALSAVLGMDDEILEQRRPAAFGGAHGIEKARHGHHAARLSRHENRADPTVRQKQLQRARLLRGVGSELGFHREEQSKQRHELWQVIAPRSAKFRHGAAKRRL